MNNSELELSRHEQAQSLHQQVMTRGALAAENIFDMAKALKDIRDGKFYKELGYGNFESYCEEMVGMKRANAYRYISIVENLKTENVSSMRQIGMTKLALLASLSEEKQAEVAETVDLESVSVRELKEEINKLKGEKMLIENEREKLNAKLEAEAANAEEARSDLEKAKKELETAKKRGNKWIVSELEEKIQELKDRNGKLFTEVQNAKDDVKKAQKKEQEAWGKLSIATTDSENRLIRIEQLERENKELRERPVDVAVVDNSDSERRLQETIRSLERENIRQNELMDQRYAEDRRELEEQKQREIDAIRAEYEQKLREVQTEGGEDKDKQEFKVYLVMAHNALTRLAAIAGTHTEPIYAEKVRELLNKASKMLEV